MIHKLLTTFVCCYCCWNFCLAQSGKIRFNRIKASSEISFSSVDRILKDHEGYMWFISGEGVARFDGTKFHYYTGERISETGFNTLQPQSIFEDSKKNLWLGTQQGILLQFQRDVDRFIPVNDSLNALGGRIYYLLEDPKQNLWVGTMGGGLYHFDPGTKQFKHYTNQRSDTTSIWDNYVTSMAYDREGNLWIGTAGGLCKYEPLQDKFRRFRLTYSDPSDAYRYRVLRSLRVGSDGYLYIGSYGGLHRFNTKTFEDEHFIHNPADPNSISHNSIFRIVEDDENALWIATYGGGLNRFDPVTKKFRHWKMDSADPYGLVSDNIFEIYPDDQGILWIGTADNGLCYYDKNHKKFRSITHNSKNESSISPGWVRTIFQENDSIYWIGFNGKGLNRYNLSTGTAKRFSHDPLDPSSLGHNTVVAIDRDSRGMLWLGLEGGGINRLDPKTGKFVRFEYSPKKNSIRNNAVAALLVDEEDNVWVTTYRDGLNVYSISEKRFYYFSNDSLLKHQDISFAQTENIKEHKKNIWFETATGIVVFDKRSNQFVKIPASGRSIQTSIPLIQELSSFPSPEMIFITQNNQVKSIQYFSRDSITEKIIFVEGSKENQSYRCVESDKQGNLWLMTRRELIQVNTLHKSVRRFSAKDGLTESNFGFKMYVDTRGRIFLTTFDGVNWFDPLEITDNKTLPKVVFSDFKIYNESVHIDHSDSSREYSIKKHISKLSVLELTHHQSFFSFEFSALHYPAADKIEYAYMMEGFDKNWVYSGHRNFATYTNLDPGSYTFRVKAQNPDGYWNEEGASIKVTILPPFWKTWWFMLLIALIIISITYFLHRYRLVQSLKVERLRNKIASDLHDEVGSSLTRISIYSDLLRNGLEEKERKNYLKSISEMSREIVSTMSDIVWSIDNRNDTFGALILRMKDFAVEVLQAKNITVTFDTHVADENKTMDPGLKQNIYLVFKESVNNIIKHANASEVLISLHQKSNNFEMIVKDNGHGFNTTESFTGHGLRNMKRRARTIGATFSIHNKNGTTVALNWQIT